MDIKALIASSIGAVKLKILVFGPQVAKISTDVRTAKLQTKRIEIRAKLEALGHHVRYAEDLVDPTLPGMSGNAVIQELLIMGEYDFIVTLVDSPGSIAEATLISTRPELARKAALFIDDAYTSGLVADACRSAEGLGAHFATYAYPNDLDACNLFGKIELRASQIQTIKYLL